MFAGFFSYCEMHLMPTARAVRRVMLWTVAGLVCVMTQAVAAPVTVKVVSLMPDGDSLTEAEFRTYRMVSNMFSSFNYDQNKVFVEYETYEKRSKFEKAAQNAAAILSCFDVEMCEKDAALAAKLGRPLIGPLSGAPNLRPNKNAWSFPVRVSEKQEVAKVLDTAHQLSAKKIVIGVENNAYGKRLAAYLAAAKKPADVEILGQFTLSATGNQADLVRRVARQRPAAIVFLSNKPNSVRAFVNTWKQQRITFSPSLLHTSALANQTFGRDLVGYFGGAVFMTTVPDPWSGSSALQRGHQKEAQDAGIYGLSYRSLEMYLATKVLLQALSSGAKTPDAVAAYLKKQKRINVGGFKLSYAQDPNVTNFMEFAVLGKSGEFRH